MNLNAGDRVWLLNVAPEYGRPWIVTVEPAEAERARAADWTVVEAEVKAPEGEA